MYFEKNLKYNFEYKNKKIILEISEKYNFEEHLKRFDKSSENTKANKKITISIFTSIKKNIEHLKKICKEIIWYLQLFFILEFDLKIEELNNFKLNYSEGNFKDYRGEIQAHHFYDTIQISTTEFYIRVLKNYDRSEKTFKKYMNMTNCMNLTNEYNDYLKTIIKIINTQNNYALSFLLIYDYFKDIIAYEYYNKENFSVNQIQFSEYINHFNDKNLEGIEIELLESKNPYYRNRKTIPKEDKFTLTRNKLSHSDILKNNNEIIENYNIDDYLIGLLIKVIIYSLINNFYKKG